MFIFLISHKIGEQEGGTGPVVGGGKGLASMEGRMLMGKVIRE
jgi:hypothetical protein